MTADWKTAPISEWPIEIIDGDRSHNYPKDEEFVGDGIPFFSTGNVSDGRLDLSGLRYVTLEKYNQIKKGRLTRGDVLMTTRGTIGRVARFDCRFCTGLINAQMLILRADQSQLNSLFLFYILRSASVQATLKNFSSGSAQPQIPIRDLRCVPIIVPPIDIQHRIAAILGAYDDLIEVNRRRVALLEDMARGLFEEWFVRFRFSGHENVPVNETSNGLLPEGWTWSSADRLLDFDPKTRVPHEGEKPFVSMGHLDTSTSVIAAHELREGNSGAKFQNGDVLFARITPCLENGKTGLVRDLPGGVGFGSTEFIVIRRARAGSSFAYCLARSDRFRSNAKSSMSGASGRQRARTEAVSAFTIATPPGSLLFDQFESATAPMLDAVGRYARANTILAASRDLLLPRLISGQLSVAAAERELLEAA